MIGPIKWCFVILILSIHIRTFADKKFSDFFVIFSSRIMQWSLSKHTLHIHIRPSS